ncbi:zinc finger CCHC domain-containing protein 9-like [Lampetra fluviatilis]
MTRWARANNAHRKRPGDATPWEVQQQEQNQETREQNQETRKKAKKAKYEDPDVNGFLAAQRAARAGGAGDGAGVDAATAGKRERRREERRLRRQHKKLGNMVCFQCREPGHGVADCPRDPESGAGICFRCGSTEHELGACRARIDALAGELPFAKCFICGEMGHLSRSCPDNPRGLYATGGGCRECGSVEHFHKDCPLAKRGGAASALTLTVWEGGGSADADPALEAEAAAAAAKAPRAVRAPRVVTF